MHPNRRSGCQGRGRPCKSWKESGTDDLRLWNITPNMVHDWSKWKNAQKTAMKIPTCRNHGKVAQSGKVSKYIKCNINPTGKSNKNPNDNEDKSKYLIHGAI